MEMEQALSGKVQEQGEETVVLAGAVWVAIDLGQALQVIVSVQVVEKRWHIKLVFLALPQPVLIAVQKWLENKILSNRYQI